MTLFRHRFILVLLILITPLSALFAQDDIEGSGDHPLVERVAGSYIFTFQTSEYERVSIPTAPATSNGFESAETLEGKYFEYTYRFEDDDVSTNRTEDGRALNRRVELVEMR